MVDHLFCGGGCRITHGVGILFVCEEKPVELLIALCDLVIGDLELELLSHELVVD